MLNKEDIRKLRKELDRHDDEREEVIGQSRKIIRKSKEVIYGLHRDDDVTQDMQELEKMISELKKSASQKLIYSGSYKVACQEYVEARVFHDIVKKGSVTPSSELGLEAEHYILGLIDVTGELVRRAINQVIKGSEKDALPLKDIVSEIYDQLSQFNFSNGEIRKKFDSIKYDLQKLENLIMELKLKEKI